MLRTLLEERFRLEARQETIQTDCFALVEAKGGAKLREYHPGDSSRVPAFPDGAHALTTAGLSDLIAFLEPVVGRPAVNHTGLTGNYRIVLAYTLPLDANAGELADRAPDIYTALQEQAGLKLEPRRGPVQILTIDHAEKVPTED